MRRAKKRERDKRERRLSKAQTLKLIGCFINVGQCQYKALRLGVFGADRSSLGARFGVRMVVGIDIVCWFTHRASYVILWHYHINKMAPGIRVLGRHDRWFLWVASLCATGQSDQTHAWHWALQGLDPFTRTAASRRDGDSRRRFSWFLARSVGLGHVFIGHLAEGRPGQPRCRDRFAVHGMGSSPTLYKLGHSILSIPTLVSRLQSILWRMSKVKTQPRKLAPCCQKKRLAPVVL